MRDRRWIICLLAIVVLMAVQAGCSSSEDSPTAAVSPSATASSSQQFTSRAFSVPFTVTLPGSLKPEPSEEIKNLVTWSTVSGEPGVRFLLPVVLYQPDSTSPQPPPKDYLTYLRGLVSAGAMFTNESKTTASGQEVTVLTGSSSRALDGTLGCPAATTPIEVCFGLQPELDLRIAVVNAGGKTLLAWARTERGAPDAAGFFAEFETMIRSLQLR